MIQPWDRGVLGAIEKAIIKSDIGLVPNVDGTVVRLNIPPLTEERRKDLVRVVHKRMEEARVEIRNLRRDAADDLKKEERDGAVGRDEAHRQLDPSRRRPIGSSPRSTASARRRSRRSSRSSVPRSPLARPTDAPPRRTSRRPRGGATIPTPAGRRDRPAARRAAAARRDHHGRQPPLGPPPRPGRARGPRRRRRGDPGLLKHAVRRGVPVLTLYAFSRENWARSDDEVTRPVRLLEQAIRSETDELRAEGVRIRLLGRLDELPDDTRRRSARRSRRPPVATRLLLNIAFNYAGRTELVDASGGSPRAASPPRPSTRPRSRAALYTAGLPDPDLVIRTGGEQRLSNFLIWQSAYAEFYTEVALARLRRRRLRRGAARVRQPNAGSGADRHDRRGPARSASARSAPRSSSRRCSSSSSSAGGGSRRWSPCVTGSPRSRSSGCSTRPATRACRPRHRAGGRGRARRAPSRAPRGSGLLLSRSSDDPAAVGAFTRRPARRAADVDGDRVRGAVRVAARVRRPARPAAPELPATAPLAVPRWRARLDPAARARRVVVRHRGVPRRQALRPARSS